MNCYEWRHLNCTITYTVDAVYSGLPIINGICLVHARRPTIRRLMRCGVPAAIFPGNPDYIEARSIMRRESHDCKRFNLNYFPEYNEPNGLDTTNVYGGSLIVLTNCFKPGPGPSASKYPQSKPWDEADPFYYRALTLWDALPAYQKSFTVFLCDRWDSGIVAAGTMPEWSDGATANIIGYEDDIPVITGTITMNLNFNV